MTTTNTNDTEATINQCIRAIEAGAELVRITAQGVKEASNLKNIKEGLLERGYNTPLVADIHFNPAAAMEAALGSIRYGLTRETTPIRGLSSNIRSIARRSIRRNYRSWRRNFSPCCVDAAKGA
jgi:hypothetical protein